RFDAQGSGFDAVVRSRRSRCVGSFAFCGTGVAADPDTACLADTGLKGSVLAMVPATRRMWFCRCAEPEARPDVGARLHSNEASGAREMASPTAAADAVQRGC